MTVNPKSFELRNLLGQRPEGVKQSCGVCGKPHASLTKEAKELPLHKRAIAEDWAGNFRNLSKALGNDKLLDFAGRVKFNAQLEWHRDMLTQAREEHDAMPEPVKAERGSAKTKRLIAESLKMLGVTLDPSADVGAEGLAVILHREVGKLMGIKAEVAEMTQEVTAPAAPAPVQDEIPVL